jgi:hypothetical protein
VISRKLCRQAFYEAFMGRFIILNYRLNLIFVTHPSIRNRKIAQNLQKCSTMFPMFPKKIFFHFNEILSTKKNFHNPFAIKIREYETSSSINQRFFGYFLVAKGLVMDY